MVYINNKIWVCLLLFIINIFTYYNLIYSIKVHMFLIFTFNFNMHNSRFLYMFSYFYTILLYLWVNKVTKVKFTLKERSIGETGSILTSMLSWEFSMISNTFDEPRYNIIVANPFNSIIYLGLNLTGTVYICKENILCK